MKPLRHFTTLTRLWAASLSDHIIALTWSPDGRYVAAAAIDGPIQVLDGATGTLVAQYAGHRFGTMALAWKADSQLLASGGQDGVIRLWDINTGTVLSTLEAGAMWVEHLAWSPAGDAFPPQQVLASAAGKTLRLWESTGHLLRSYPEHPSTIAAIQWQPHAPYLTSAAYSRVALWDITSDTPQRDFQWKGSILTMSWSPDGRYIAAGEQDATVHFWFAKTGKDLQMWGYPTKVRALSWSADSRWLATGGAAEVTVWDCLKSPAGSKPLQLRAHDQLLSHLAWQHRGPWLASAGDDGRLALWKPARSTKAMAGVRLHAALTKLAWSPDDQCLAIGTALGTVCAVATPP